MALAWRAMPEPFAQGRDNVSGLCPGSSVEVLRVMRRPRQRIGPDGNRQSIYGLNACKSIDDVFPGSGPRGM